MKADPKTVSAVKIRNPDMAYKCSERRHKSFYLLAWGPVILPRASTPTRISRLNKETGQTPSHKTPEHSCTDSLIQPSCRGIGVSRKDEAFQKRVGAENETSGCSFQEKPQL
ncbi:hypothetical protein EYF80_013854 [Liparis tanakae]|uniref:Uncharacterized protein n=1 Tax=Liparis tanakae TaxID=230148 RepID=A0A4Z2IEL0_9TELE|nr:hypothetical protein EYF80_013854 [Liparis tanakae]